MRALAGLARAVDGLNRAIGGLAGWLLLACVLICAFVAIARYAFAFGRIWLQELYVVLFGLAFMLAAAWAYGRDAHVRVDILSRRWSGRTRAAVELLGVLLLLLPWLAALLWSARGFVALSWAVREPSPQAGGLPGLYLVKAAIPLAALLLFLQGLAAAARSLLLLAGRTDLLPAPGRGDAGETGREEPPA